MMRFVNDDRVGVLRHIVPEFFPGSTTIHWPGAADGVRGAMQSAPFAERTGKFLSRVASIRRNDAFGQQMPLSGSAKDVMTIMPTNLFPQANAITQKCAAEGIGDLHQAGVAVLLIFGEQRKDFDSFLTHASTSGMVWRISSRKARA